MEIMYIEYSVSDEVFLKLHVGRKFWDLIGKEKLSSRSVWVSEIIERIQIVMNWLVSLPKLQKICDAQKI